MSAVERRRVLDALERLGVDDPAGVHLVMMNVWEIQVHRYARDEQGRITLDRGKPEETVETLEIV